MTKFLIVDDSASLRTLLKKRLIQHWADAEIDTYDPSKSGIPAKNFIWEQYDLVFLDYDLGLDRYTGLNLLAQIKSTKHSPAVIMLTGQGNENIAADAIKAGADDYLIKYDVVTDTLFEMTQEILSARTSVHHSITDNHSAAGGKTGGNKNPDNWDIPGYRCLSEIANAASVTLLAERLGDRKLIVLKIHPLQESKTQSVQLKRFVRELNTLSELDHPNVIKVLDHGVTENYLFYAMEYFPLGDLGKYIKKNSIPMNQAVTFTKQIALGLQALHQKDIIHRDVKPSNILFKNDNTLIVADLGIAKDLSCSEALTVKGEILGTPNYMSPEQFNSDFLDARTDIYSLGVMFYELLTGKLPFTGNTIMAVVYQHIYEEPQKLPDSVSAYQAIIDKVLAKKPADRYQHISQFIAAIDNIIT